MSSLDQRDRKHEGLDVSAPAKADDIQWTPTDLAADQLEHSGDTSASTNSAAKAILALTESQQNVYPDQNQNASVLPGFWELTKNYPEFSSGLHGKHSQQNRGWLSTNTAQDHHGSAESTGSIFTDSFQAYDSLTSHHISNSDLFGLSTSVPQDKSYFQNNTSAATSEFPTESKAPAMRPNLESVNNAFTSWSENVTTTTTAPSYLLPSLKPQMSTYNPQTGPYRHPSNQHHVNTRTKTYTDLTTRAETAKISHMPVESSKIQNTDFPKFHHHSGPFQDCQFNVVFDPRVPPPSMLSPIPGDSSRTWHTPQFCRPHSQKNITQNMGMQAFSGLPSLDQQEPSPSMKPFRAATNDPQKKPKVVQQPSKSPPVLKEVELQTYEPDSTSTHLTKPRQNYTAVKGCSGMRLETGQGGTTPSNIFGSNSIGQSNATDEICDPKVGSTDGMPHFSAFDGSKLKTVFPTSMIASNKDCTVQKPCGAISKQNVPYFYREYNSPMPSQETLMATTPAATALFTEEHEQPLSSIAFARTPAANQEFPLIPCDQQGRPNSFEVRRGDNVPPEYPSRSPWMLPRTASSSWISELALEEKRRRNREASARCEERRKWKTEQLKKDNQFIRETAVKLFSENRSLWEQLEGLREGRDVGSGSGHNSGSSQLTSDSELN